MRFWTIWTLPACSLSERLRRTRDWAAMKIGARLPLRIRFWVTIKEIGHASRESENVPATTLSEILDNLNRPKTLT